MNWVLAEASARGPSEWTAAYPANNVDRPDALFQQIHILSNPN